MSALAAFTMLICGGFAITASAQAPDWQVNPADFESNMSVAAVLVLDGFESTDENDLVAAFAGDEVRGVAEAVDGGTGLRFFLTVYSDLNGEEISFRAYVDAEGRVFDLAETITFAANGIVGTVSDPLVLSTATLGGCSRGQPGWAVNPPDFESNMSVTAQVRFDGVVSSDPADLLAAFVDAEVRGVAPPTDTPTGQAFFLTVYSNTSGEDISFAAYDAVNDLVVPIDESLTFVPNAINGTPNAPFALTASCAFTTTSTALPDPIPIESVSVYPNPFTDAATIDIDLAFPGFVMIEVVDLLGRTVWHRESSQMSAGTHSFTIHRDGLPSGVYLYRVTQGSKSRHGIISVVK
ncbi:MAG: T9SS type A sorting domain-containing protein [Rhodothermia bacterium]|nr:T9SS type A sorting domain-containing protein [Rhodothermia bacterium]